MIVCENGKFIKKDYRTFTIRDTMGAPDDYASMKEALRRRLDHILNPTGSGFGETPPDLILLDGGKGHVSTVQELMDELGLDIPVLGMVKDEFHKTRALTDGEHEINIAREQSVFVYIYKIQEEVHRYTVSKMDSAKRKTLKTSSLTKIDGIGDAKAKKLLAAFGGIGAIKTAEVEQIAAVRGISVRDAETVWQYFHKNGTH
jgi:excinuclease ABC subunit C